MSDIAHLHERVTGVRVSKTLLCGDDHIVLLDYSQASQSRVWANFRRLKSTGDIVWATSTPSSSDIFVDVELAGWASGRVDLGVLHDYRGSGDRQACRGNLHQMSN